MYTPPPFPPSPSPAHPRLHAQLYPTCLRMTMPHNDCCTHVRVETREVPLGAISRVTLSCNDMLALYGLDQVRYNRT